MTRECTCVGTCGLLSGRERLGDGWHCAMGRANPAPVAGSSLAPEKKPEPLEGCGCWCHTHGTRVVHASPCCAEMVEGSLEGEPRQPSPVRLTTFAEPQESALAPLFRDFARIFGGLPK